MALLKDWFYKLVVWIARFHDMLIGQNLGFADPFTDKELHFIVIGIFGLLLFLLAFPLFRYLTRHGRAGIMCWLFTLSTVFFVCFAIEVGQRLTKTGKMQLEDIVYGIVGFFAASICFALLILLVRIIKRLFQRK